MILFDSWPDFYFSPAREGRSLPFGTAERREKAASGGTLRGLIFL